MDGNRRRWPAIVIAVLIAVAAARMAATFRVFSATNDEATHVGAGLELLEYHRYQLQRVNPPLPRVIFALAPWLGGMRIDGNAPSYGEQLHSVFYGHGDYQHNLALARAGNLVFFVIAAIALGAWARRELGEWESVLAVLFFTMESVILGYSALATHDGPAAAGVAVAMWALSRWMKLPDARRAAVLGAAFAFAVLCKFSCLAFVPVAWGAVLLIRRMARLSLLIVPIVAALVIWAGYAFQIEPFVSGVREIIDIDRAGFVSYALGNVSTVGWWWYFPLAVLLKTTLPLLALLLAGVLFRHWKMAEGLVPAMAILVVAMPSTLDIGMRYVLPLYVPLCFAAAAVAGALLRDHRRVVRALAIVLLVADVGVSIAAHPDYFPYFNALAGRDPSRYLVDSNLDWGQDVLRLRHVARELRIERLGVALMGTADLDALRFPPRYSAQPSQPATGWIAVSDHAYRMARWPWLAGQPYRRVGKSIRLYLIRG